MAAGAQARRARLRAGEPNALLAGRWSVRRELLDRRTGRRGGFVGTADFTPDGPGLRWHEAGHLTFGRHDGPATRTLLVVPASGGGWEVRFPDSRLFHALDLADGACDAVHPCGADVYRGRYELLGRDRLRVRWAVTGPEADEALDATYVRLPCVW